MDMDDRIALQKRKSHQQAGDELGAVFPGNIHFAGKQGTLYGQWYFYVSGSLVSNGSEDGPEFSHYHGGTF